MTRVTEDELLASIAAAPRDVALRLVYADWLEEAGDARANVVRLQLETAPLPPDHPDRSAKEAELSRWREGCAADWLGLIEPERAHQLLDPVPRGCSCFRLVNELSEEDLDELADDEEPPTEWLPVDLDNEPQDTECDAWKRLLDLVDRAAEERATQFNPFKALRPEDRCRIVTLPPSIAKLTSVTSLDLYGSHLARLPPEIGALTALGRWTPYTSYRLHWFPYEITRCKNLRGSTVSTRALFGNYKLRYPFPKLGPTAHATNRRCSVCEREFEDHGVHRVWISLVVGSDVLPLLVNACSDACVESLPPTPDGYVKGPHRGGVELVQPERR
jgi:uncharacterized protein (TIGR02996 family)